MFIQNNIFHSLFSYISKNHRVERKQHKYTNKFWFRTWM